jgi:leucine efflux protein
VIFGITDLTTFILGTIFIVLIPGPNSLLVITLASRQGLRSGFLAAAGIFAGDTVLMLLAATGAASALQASPMLFQLLKYLGAGYLVWLGVGLLRSAFAGYRQGANGGASVQPVVFQDNTKPFQAALMISLLNPKAIMFFVSFFIQFVDPAYPHPWLSFLILGVIVQFFSLIFLYVLIVGGVRLANYFEQRQTLSAAGQATVGVLFIGFGLRLAAGGLN